MKQQTTSRSHARAHGSIETGAIKNATLKQGTFVRGMLSEDAFVIRPVNRDNQRELDQVIELLQRHQNSDALSRGISDFEFLSGQFSDLESDEQMVSMLLFHQVRPVAHVALKFDGDSRCPEIVLPAIDPEYEQYLMTFSELFWQKIQHLAELQDWEMIYQISPTVDAALQIVTAKQCNALEMAILPEAGSHRPPNQALVLLTHLFKRNPSEQHFIYPPVEHAKKVNELYTALEANRIVVRGDETTFIQSTLKGTPLKLRWRRLAGLEEIRVIPSELTDLPGFIAQVEECASKAETQSSSFWVKIAMDDPKCGSFCRLLEERGLKFCGIFPISEKRDWILYSKMSSRTRPIESLRTPRGRQLSQYILGAART